MSSFVLIFSPDSSSRPPPVLPPPASSSAHLLVSSRLFYLSLCLSFLSFRNHASSSRGSIGDFVAHDEDDKTRQAFPQGPYQLFSSLVPSSHSTPLIQDTLDLFATLIVSLELTTNRQYFRTFPNSFTTYVSPYLLDILLSSHALRAEMTQHGTWPRSSSRNRIVGQILENPPASLRPRPPRPSP